MNSPGPDDDRRAAIAESIPEVDDSTPVAAQLAQDARRRIALTGKRFPKPAHTRIIAVANQKGGVGKTSTAVNMAAALAIGGLNVVVVDADPQGNASTALSVPHHTDVVSLYDALIGDVPLLDAIVPCPQVRNLWAIPATIDLSGAEIELVSLVSRETRMRQALERLQREWQDLGRPRFDYVIIDCPPSLGLLTVNAFVAAQEILIPIQCEYYALEGVSQLMKNIELVRRHLNNELVISTILLTMYDARTNLSRGVAEDVREHFAAQTLATTIPRSVRISEAPSYGQTVMTYDPSSSGALAYLEAARELAERGRPT